MIIGQGLGQEAHWHRGMVAKSKKHGGKYLTKYWLHGSMVAKWQWHGVTKLQWHMSGEVEQGWDVGRGHVAPVIEASRHDTPRK